MTKQEATAQVFLAAFKALPRKERDAFLTSLVKDPKIREDLLDLAIAEIRSKENGSPLKEFLTELYREKGGR